MTSQKFGGDWTAKKLNIFTSYLDAYLIALQNQKFKKIYIDAFAGTGEIETATVKHIWQGLQRGRCLQRNGLITTILLRAMKAKRPSLNT